MIVQSVTGLLATPAFQAWLENQSPNDGDIIVVNNSFIYRKPLIRTSKNPQYICVRVKGRSPDPADVRIGALGDLKSDFRLFSRKSDDLPRLELLDSALNREMHSLGRLVFVLIGRLQDVPTSTPITHAHVKELRFDPTAKRTAALVQREDGSKVIVLNQVRDPEAAWGAVRGELQREMGSDIPRLQSAFAAGFEKLQSEARFRLLLPHPSARRTSKSFIARLRRSLSEQRKLYDDALQRYVRSDALSDAYLREVMRIAYNFADDAIKILQLLVSICDLKAVLLWCTIREQFEVAEAFRQLPWTKTLKKPSLARYREVISGARNRAFHNLLAFDRTVEADLTGVDVKARRLILLPAYSRRKTTVAFDYEDRELVEILSGLTRAPEVTVPLDFWRKNLQVIEAFESLLKATEDALWNLNHALGS